MRGSLNDFSARVGQTSKSVLKEYASEIELALGPIKTTTKAKIIDKEQNIEEEIR